MKRVVVVGENSYIARSFQEYSKERLEVTMVSSRDDRWKEVDFFGYDAVLHCAAVVHRKQKKNMRSLYFKVNKDLAVAVAQKAKKNGVRQFVFLSTMSVFGMDKGVVTSETSPGPKPENLYASSKYEAEKALSELNDLCFHVAIIRPPMVYGANCKGNFQRLLNLVVTVPFFPDIKNERSMIYIENLSAFLSELVENGFGGTFHPQDGEYICTSEMAKIITEAKGKKLCLTTFFNPFIQVFISVADPLSKLFESYCYSKEMSSYDGIVYQKAHYRDAIVQSIMGNRP
jgi:UDP-glucose 4-epimerase